MKCEECGKYIEKAITIGPTNFDKKTYDCVCETCSEKIYSERRENAIAQEHERIDRGIKEGEFKYVLNCWLNTEYKKMDKAVKPCWVLHFCPYGPLVEYYPITESEFSCDVFGHDCPVFYNAEAFEDGEEKEVKK